VSRVTFAVPVEAIRQGTTAEGDVTLARLAADRAEFQPTAIVELFPGGFIATLVYSKPGFPGRMHHAHVGLVWAPVENALAQDGGGA
jgi:hypothetical protein